MAERERFTLTSCKSVATGSKNGVPWTIYELEAEFEDGMQVDEQLRSWSRLRVGELLEFDVEEDPRGGPCLWLRGPPASVVPAEQKLALLVEQQGVRIAELERQVVKLTELVSLL